MRCPGRISASPRDARAATLAFCAALVLVSAGPAICATRPIVPEGIPIQALVPAPGAPSLDQGRLIISQHGKPVRAEDFVINQAGRALIVTASSTVSRPGQPERPVDKDMILIMGAMEYDIERYRSEWIVGADTLVRGVEWTPGDTVCTIWRDTAAGGTGDRVAMPPGRVYVLDPPLFTTFTLIARSLHEKVCERRPIQVLILGARDSLVAGTVNELGTETIRWGGRPVVARKLVISDAQTDFTAWVSPDGRLLRLEQPTTETRVDREAPALKRRPPRSP